MNETMSPEQVIEVTISNLNRISVPVELHEQIAVPISMCIGNLRLILEAVAKAKEEKEKPDEENVIDFGDMSEVAEDGQEADAE